MNKYINLILVIIIALIGLAFFVVIGSNNQDSTRAIEKNIDSIRQLMTLESNWSLSTLSAYNDPLSNFDKLASFLPKYRELTGELTKKSPLDDEDLQLVKNKQSQFLLLLQSKEDIVEEFKSNFAVIRNSLKYLPLAVTAFSEFESSTEADRLFADDVSQYYNKLNAFLNASTEEGKRELLASLNSLQVRADSASAESIDVFANFSSHARAVVDRKIAFDDTLTQLANSRVGEVGQDLIQIYTNLALKQDAKAQQFQFQQKVLFLALVVVGLLACAFSWFGSRKQALEINRYMQDSQPADEGDNEKSDTINQAIVREITIPLNEIEDNLSSLDNGVLNVELLVNELAEFEQDLVGNQDEAYIADRSQSLLELLSHMNKEAMLNELVKVNSSLSKSIKKIQDISGLKGSHREELVMDEDEPVKDERVDVAQCIAASLKSNREAALASHAKIVKDIGDLPLLYVSEEKIKQVLTHLINNAIDIPRKDSATQKLIKVKAINDKNNIVVSVVDNGVGFDSELQNKIFKSPAASKGADIDKESGLFAVQRIIKQYGGKILVKSVAQKGTNITFTLPVSANS